MTEICCMNSFLYFYSMLSLRFDLIRFCSVTVVAKEAYKKAFESLAKWANFAYYYMPGYVAIM